MFRQRRAFTLIEILVVVMIISLIGSIAYVRITHDLANSRIKTTAIQINSLRTALEKFNLTVGRFPTTEEGLQALVKRPASLTAVEYPERCLDRLPSDAWGQPFAYKAPGDGEDEYEIYSSGPDKHFGTRDDLSSASN